MDLSGYALAILHQDAEFVLWRGIATASPTPHPTSVLVSMPRSERPGLDRIRMLEHELAMRAELDSTWAVRPLGLGQHEGRAALILEDQPGEPLERLLDQPPVSRAPRAPRSAEPAMELGLFLRLAAGLAEALGGAHRRGLIHKDVKPAHVLVNTATGHAWLLGFGIASRLPRERPRAEAPEFISGTLAYMAPEQTGRMNRSIDGRSDLYSLGVTLYRMLTGLLPFIAAEPIEWVHCHLARQPTAPGELVANVPAPVSAIIMKLLAKTADERYQTAGGLERDLRRCLAQWEDERRIGDFPLGAHDTPDRLVLPEGLYGRASEVETLLTAFDRVVQGGRPELVLVSGYSGIGKSSVVNELHKVLVPPRALFAAGKFDQYKRDIPYATLAQAFQSLARSLLAKSDIELADWCGALREALGPNGQVMVDLVPELRLIIGEQAPVPELPPRDAQRRFQLVLRRFFAVFARADRPLALFLDDLQWLDAATLGLLEDLLTHPDVRHVLLIGAYRDNEVTAGHPLMGSLDRIRSAGAPVHQIVLAPLTREQVGHLVADSLYSDQDAVAPLAELVHQKTGGNPFFVIQFLSALVEEGLISFDHGAARWSWDLARIHAKAYTDNVVGLMVRKLGRVPIQTQTALRRLACLGNIASTATLSLVQGTSEERVHDDLWEAVRHELIDGLDGSYRFLHDRIHEAAYSLIPKESRPAEHLRVGRLLLEHTPPEKREETIFDIVNQLNRGAALIASREEREQLAGLNLIAGRRAKASTAYTAALNYLVVGGELLADEGWRWCHELTFALELNRAECEFLTGDVEAAEKRLAELSTLAVGAIEEAPVACLRIDLYMTLNRIDRGIEAGLDYLRRRGIEWSPHPTDGEARQEYERIWSQLGSRTVEQLIDLPWMTQDPDSLATLEVLSRFGTPALYTDQNLKCLAICRAINLGLEHGHSEGSCTAYAWLAMLAGPHFGDYKAGFLFGQLGHDLADQWALKRFQPATYNLFGGVVLPITKHLREGLGMVRRAFAVANEIGDLAWAAYSTMVLTGNLLVAGGPLADVQREAESGLQFAKNARFGFVVDLVTGDLGLIRTLRGLSRAFGSFDDGQLDERQFERHLSTTAGSQFAECYWWIRKMQARFFAGDYAAALDAAAKVQKPILAHLKVLGKSEHGFFAALSHAGACDLANAGERGDHLEAMAGGHLQLEMLAENCPDNFAHRAALVGAEIARLEGRPLEAMDLYERAIDSAKANAFVNDEALANELAARFYAARGVHTIAHAYLRNARYGYLRWGADGKVRQLDEVYPHLKMAEAAPAPPGTIAAPLEQLDLATVIKISQAVSGEVLFERLLETMMRAAIEQAGAERALLILSGEIDHRIAAEATSSNETVLVRSSDERVNGSMLPETVFRYALHTREIVVVDDAAIMNPFSGDSYFAQRHARSVLCVPLTNQAKLIGALYFENNLAPRVFGSARIAVLKLLASQAAVSLENTRLYRDLKASEAQLRRAHTHLTEAQRLSQSGSFTWDVQADHHTWSAETYRIFGVEPESTITMPVIEAVIHPEDLPAVAAVIGGAVEGTDFDLVLRIVTPSGARKHVHVVGHRSQHITDRPVFVGAVQDVTESKIAEEALRESEREARLIVETIPGLVGVLTPAGEVEHVNGQVLGYFGRTPEELKLWETIDAIHPADLPDFKTAWQHAIETGQPFDLDYRIRRADGPYRWFQMRGHSLRDAEGQIIRWYILLTDIDDRVKAESELRTLKDQLYKENLVLRDEVDRASMFEEIVGASQTLKAVLSRIAKVAPTDSTVFISGETGTGKELIARAVHKRSRRSGRAFVSVNCAALAPTLISSELFGHEKGAFTGATQRRLGRFELADGGTIFLDEVGELLPDTQAMLLRVLQEREFERVGGTQPVHVDVRVIAATNRDLRAAIANGSFRQDLYYRLNVFPVQVPPLRERKDDLLMLVEYFVQRYASRAGKHMRSIDKKTLDLLQAYDWPGNIRELQNVIERSVILSSGSVFSVDELWLSTQTSPQAPEMIVSMSSPGGSHGEREIIEAALAETRGRVAGPSGAAAKLSIPASTLAHRIKTLKIDKRRFKFR